MTAVSAVVFPGGSCWPLFVARDAGFLAQEHLEVALTFTPDSAFQMRGLVAGAFDMAVTAFDNVVAYNLDAGEARSAELVAVSGYDHGFLSLAARPDITSVSDLRGQAVAVDAPDNGFAFVLYEMLARHGLERADVNLVRAGGVAERWKGLAAHQFAATLLVSPLDLVAEDAGFNILSRGADICPGYQGQVLAVRRSWALEHSRTLTHWLRAQALSIRWLADRANQEAASEILLRNAPAFPPTLAARAYGRMLDPRTGYQADTRFDPQGAEAVMSLRARHGPAAERPPVSAHVDLSYFATALASITDPPPCAS